MYRSTLTQDNETRKKDCSQERNRLDKAGK